MNILALSPVLFATGVSLLALLIGVGLVVLLDLKFMSAVRAGGRFGRLRRTHLAVVTVISLAVVASVVGVFVLKEWLVYDVLKW